MKTDIMGDIQKSKDSRKKTREDFRAKLLESAQKYKEEGSPLRSAALRAAEFMMPGKDEDPDIAALGTFNPGKSAVQGVSKAARKFMREEAKDAFKKAEYVSDKAIEFLRKQGVEISDRLLSSPEKKMQFVKGLVDKNTKKLDLKKAAERAEKWDPTTVRNRTDTSAPVQYRPEVKEDAYKLYQKSLQDKKVPKVKEKDFSGLIPKDK